MQEDRDSGNAGASVVGSAEESSMAVPAVQVKVKKCRVCRRPYEPRNSLQACCSSSCAITYARLGGEKRQSAAMKRVALAQDREDRERLKTLGDLLKEAQRHF